MKIDCDEEQDIIYIRFSDSKYAYSDEKGEVVVDYDEEGKVIAIEIFDASRFLKGPLDEIIRAKKIRIRT